MNETGMVGASSAVRESRARVLAASDFIALTCERAPALLGELVSSGDLERSLTAADFEAHAPRFGLTLLEAQTMAELRRWRQREMLRIAWRDLAGWAAVEETLADLSAFADAAIRVACQWARAALVSRHGEPRSATGDIQPLVILGMGKLGGRELNFSSDVDLIFLFPEHGETDGERPISNEEFFTRHGQALIRLLDARTSDGFVFRVDMRLRPFGDSGPLVASFASVEEYLLRHGRDWERYAYVKARPITAPERYAELYASAIRPFVYRRYIDYGVFESLREMKALIGREVERRELADHIKLGPGGIREIEFIVQAFQLIRGGSSRKLQTPSLLAALPLLEGGKLLPAEAVAELRDAYIYLRRLENRLQMLDDAQTHRLPKDETSQRRIATAMGAPDWRAFLAELNAHRQAVSRHFNSVVFGGAAKTDAKAVHFDLGRLGQNEVDAAAISESLIQAGFLSAGQNAGSANAGSQSKEATSPASGPTPNDEAGEAARLLVELRASSFVRRLDEPGRRRLESLLPPLLADIGAGAARLPVLRRILKILEAIGQRSVYFALLSESGVARKRLVELCAHGDFLADQIAAHPALLDELIDERLFSELPDRHSLARDLDLIMQQPLDDDPERQVEALRHFQRAAIFHVAVADLTGRLPIMKVSDRLTDIAELIVDRAIGLGWHQITAQFGVPMCAEGGARRAVQICAVGYGKLGGMELSYSSDLDLVFLHDSEGERQETSAARPIDNQLFFVRLAQRIVHLLTMHSAAGRLYEVDVRLRPSGKGGLLISQLRAFAEYQQHEAWTWEHQALLHARAVAGAPALCAEFERVRLDILQHHVRRDRLRGDVRDMRERMRRELTQGGPGDFDIKQGEGGVADIEFLAQYWALLWAKEYPPVAMFSDTIRQLESVASANLVPQATVDVLTAAYRAYRSRTHHLSLERREPIVPASEFLAERAAVTRIWNAALA